MRTKAVYPSETREARRARGRPSLSLSLTLDDLAAIDAWAEAWGTTRSGVVARLVDWRRKKETSPPALANERGERDAER